MENRTQREEQLFEAARGLKDFGERRAYLDAVCEGDAELRHGVEALLAADAKAERFLRMALPP